MTNAWMSYKVYRKVRKLKLKYSHYKFIRWIYIARIDENGHWPDRYMNGSGQSVSPVPVTVISKGGNVPYASIVNSGSLLPEGASKRRRNADLCHLVDPIPAWLKDP